jgi:hypothetical protein
MAMNPLFASFGVIGLQVLLYGLVPAWSLGRRTWRDAGEWIFAALVAGVSSAALLGRVCNGRGIGVGVVLGLWLAAWMAGGVWARRRGGDRPEVRWDGALLGILLLAAMVRLIHPLQTWALGQSDAYSHLGFLMDVLARGKVANADYPPAYAWVMAFPARLWQGHPYWVARFGGAFFGAGLVLGTHALVSQWKGRAAGLAAAALVAGCPFFFLLQKTGVGAFANQLGLFLILAALWAFASKRFGWLALALAALAVSVPMMVLHLVLLLGLWTLAEIRSRRLAGVLVLLLAAAGFGVLALAMTIPPARGMVIASMLTGDYSLAKEAGAGWGDVFRVLAADFFSFKRMGYGSWVLSGGAIGVTTMFAAALAWGFRRKEAAWMLVGIWGLLTSVNLHLGFMQFTDYQREGWSFLLALACLGGLVFDGIWRWQSGRRWRTGWAAALAASALAGLVVPPVHAILAGPGESDIVEYVLKLEPEVTVLARRMSTFPSGQGDVVRTLHPRVIHDAGDVAGAAGPVHFLRDRPPETPEIPLAMRLLQPRQIRTMEKFLRQAESETHRLEEGLAGRAVRTMMVSDHLDVWILEAD